MVPVHVLNSSPFITLQMGCFEKLTFYVNCIEYRYIEILFVREGGWQAFITDKGSRTSEWLTNCVRR